MATVNGKRATSKPRVFLTKLQRRNAEKLYNNILDSRGGYPEKAFRVVMDSLTIHEYSEKKASQRTPRRKDVTLSTTRDIDVAIAEQRLRDGGE